jgi:demethylmenaquinone methyltransferase / 2-methoxy-6-polyprenyl-1,4-benzoquinol methylase
MANRFFDPGESRAAKVHQLFGEIAPRYDLINDLQSFGLHRLWKKRVIRLARVSPGAAALDVCCGTGDLAYGLAARGASVVGVDFSDAMLNAARARQPVSVDANAMRKEGIAQGNPQFIRADAQQLPFSDNSFDAVTIGYGLRNLSSWEQGLGEVQRVLRPNGRLVVLEFGKPSNPLWRLVYFGYLKLVVPVLGRIVSRNAAAYAYILESLEHYPGQQEVARRMCQLGFHNVAVLNLLGGIMSIHCADKRQTQDSHP